MLDRHSWCIWDLGLYKVSSRTVIGSMLPCASSAGQATCSKCWTSWASSPGTDSCQGRWTSRPCCKSGWTSTPVECRRKPHVHARAGKPSTLLCASWRLIPWTGWYLKSSGLSGHKQALLAFRLGVAGLAGTIRSTRLKDQECQYCDDQGALIDQRTPLEGEAHVLYALLLNSEEDGFSKLNKQFRKTVTLKSYITHVYIFSLKFKTWKQNRMISTGCTKGRSKAMTNGVTSWVTRYGTTE